MKSNFYENLLRNNKAWAEVMIAKGDYLINMSLTQSPLLLLIGCADSRVPANVIT